MKILFLLEGIPYAPHFGHKLKSFSILAQLAKNGHEVIAVAVTPSVNEEDLAELRRNAIETIPILYKKRRSFPGYILSLPSKYAYGVIPLTRPDLCRSVEETIMTINPDVVHVELYPVARLAVNLEFPTVMSAGDCFSIFFKSLARQNALSFEGLHFRLQAWKTRRFEREYLSAFNNCIAVTPFDAEALRAEGVNADITVIPIGVDTDYFQPSQLHATGEGPVSLVFMGNMSYLPNQLAAIDFCQNALPKIRETFPDIILRIVGREPGNAVRRLASRNIIVTGTVPDVRPYLSREVVFVAPFSFHGGMKTKVLQAMSMGMAVVGTKATFSGIDALDGYHAFIADDPDRTANKVIELIGDPGLRASMGQNARDLVLSSHTWPRIVERYEKIYEAAIACAQDQKSQC